MNPTYIDPRADVDPRAVIDPIGCRIYAFTRIGPNARIGKGVTVGCHAEVDGIVGNYCSIQGGARIYHGVTLEPWVFVGPMACTTNDILPRAGSADWSDRFRETLIKTGASLCARCVIVCGVTVGEHSMVGAGAVVTHDVKPWFLVRGNPAQHIRQLPTIAGGSVEVAP